MSSSSEKNATTRRGFYGVAINLLGAAMAAVVAIPAATYLLLKPKSSGEGDLIEIADLKELRVGMPSEVTYFRTRDDGWKRSREKTTAWVVKTDNKSAVAFSPSCPHLGCAYHWQQDANSFICPCHASAFTVDGTVIEGPAARPLDRFISKIEDGKLLIGSQITKG
jgi:menaquinol-cytochrome c reductase iron-sulfur subunit